VKRRKLQFDSFAAMFEDIERLQREGYRRAGNWDLAYACCHLADAIERSMDGFVTRAPLQLRLMSPILLPIFLRVKRIPAGVNIAPEAMPQGEKDLAAEIERLHHAVARFESFEGPALAHPMFGALSKPQWTRLHLIHCAHHLSFLV
jgi:hypothetical protein